LRLVKPLKLYVAADGARTEKEGETELCNEARNVAMQMVDWDCEVHTLFRDTNLGCARAVAGGISWFFEHEEMGIIIEDDCLPDPSFFLFCSLMLDHFKHDERVMHISGFRDLDDGAQQFSYYFSYYPRIWGWATWRRAWKLYSLHPPNPSPELKSRIISTYFYGHQNAGERWFMDFQKSYARLSSWDYQWCLTIWTQHGLSVNASLPLIKNIGFDSRGTHTTDTASASDLSAIQIRSFKAPVIHPLSSVPHYHNDIRAFERHLSPTLLTRAQLKLNSVMQRAIKRHKV
jgi:hypothetical protein